MRVCFFFVKFFQRKSSKRMMFFVSENQISDETIGFYCVKKDSGGKGWEAGEESGGGFLAAKKQNGSPLISLNKQSLF